MYDMMVMGDVVVLFVQHRVPIGVVVVVVVRFDVDANGAGEVVTTYIAKVSAANNCGRNMYTRHFSSFFSIVILLISYF